MKRLPRIGIQIQIQMSSRRSTSTTIPIRPPSSLPPRPSTSSDHPRRSRSPVFRPKASGSGSGKRRSTPLSAYFDEAAKPSVRLPDSSSAGKKLVLLDLNGTLVFRPKASGERTFRRRPFVGAFLDYLRELSLPFLPALRRNLVCPWTERLFLFLLLGGLGMEGERWQVGVWSSAQPHSVGKMVEFLELQGGSKPCDLKILWARDTFGLTPAEFSSSSPSLYIPHASNPSFLLGVQTKRQKPSKTSTSCTNTSTNPTDPPLPPRSTTRCTRTKTR